MKKKFVYLLLLFGSYLNAQHFQRLPLDKETQAKTLFEDSNGLVWIGTNKGLLSYDGLSFRQYLSIQNTVNQVVTAIYEDKNKRIWVGYENGQIEFMDIKRELIAFNPEEGLPKVKITGFCEDDKGQLWFSTYGEGAYYHNGKHLYNVNSDDGLPSNDIYSIVFLNGIWVGTDSGLSCLSKENPKQIKTLNTDNGLLDNIVQKVGKKGNELIVSTFDFEKTQSYNVFDSKPTFQARTIWNNSKFINEKILNYFEGQNTLWILTEKGVYADYFYENVNIEHLKFNAQVYCDNIVSNGVSLGEFLGTDEGLYYRNFKDSIFNKIKLIDNQKVSISCIGQDENYNYIGTFQYGLFILAKKTQKVIKNLTKKDGLCDNAVLSIYENHFSTIGGLYEFNPNNLNVLDIGKKHGVAIKYVYSIFKDSKQTIWLGTDGEGIISFSKDGTVNKYNEINGKELKTVYQIKQANSGKLFFATPDMGLIALDIEKQVFKIYNTQNGLKSNNINGFKILNDNEILLSHEKNLDFFDIAQQKTLPFFHPFLEQYYEANLNILDQFHPTILLKNAFFHFNPQKTIKPKIHFQAIKNLNQVIDYQKDTLFSFDKNFFIFELTSIYYPKPDEVRFRYKLEGFDRDWNDTKDHNIIYPQLPYGDYIFRAKAVLGNYPSNEIVFKFSITPPFWKTWWFISSALTIFFLGIYLIIKERENRLRKKAKLEQDKVLAQYEAIRSQINPHFLFNTFNTLIALIEENPNKAVSFVEKLSDFFRIILQYRDQKVITIQEEIQLVKDYIYLLKQRFDDSLSIEININETEGYIAPFSLQMLIENAVKHNIVSKSKPLKINILKEENYIIVENNLQEKLQRENSTGFGLESIKKRYDLFSKDKIVVEKTAVYFRVKIPIQ